MTLLAPLASMTLALAGGHTDEHSVAPEPTPTAAAAPVADTPATPEPRKGIGLLATTGVLGATAFSVTVARNILLKKNCPLSDSMAIAQCTYDFRSDIGLATTQWVANLATVGFAPAAGTVLGRYHAWADNGTSRRRNARTMMGVGGGLIGAGVIGVGTSIALAFVLPARCVDKEISSGDALEGDRCLLKAFPAWTLTNWASFAMISSGGGLLGYGKGYKNRRQGPTATVRVSPWAGPTFAGAGVSGRF